MDSVVRITLKQLEVFIAVAQSGNVTRAAESLSITQSATSMSLSDFETQLGRKLFDRVGKRLQLNDAGRLLLPKALDAIARIQEIEAMAASDAPLIGQLRIGASLTIGNYMLPGLIGSFMRTHAGAHVTLDVANTRHVIKALEHFQIDIGFIEGEGLGLKSDPKAELMRVGEAPRGKACPSCGSYDLRMVEGCLTCGSCGHSKCG